MDIILTPSSVPLLTMQAASFASPLAEQCPLALGSSPVFKAVLVLYENGNVTPSISAKTGELPSLAFFALKA